MVIWIRGQSLPGGNTHLPLLIRPPSTLWNVTEVRKERETKTEGKKDKAIREVLVCFTSKVYISIIKMIRCSALLAAYVRFALVPA